MKTIDTTEVFDLWFESLKDRQTARRIQARIDRAEDGNFGDHKTVGEGVSEMRIHLGPGFRVYFHTARHGNRDASGRGRPIQSNPRHCNGARTRAPTQG